jgi:hypothetical protein
VTAAGWALIGAGVAFAVALSMSLSPWQAGIIVGLVVAFVGACMVADAGPDGGDG